MKPWPGFDAAALERWRAANGVPAGELARLFEAVDAPARPAAWEEGQRPGFYLDGLTARPWHDPADHPWTAALEDAWEEIRAELMAVAAHGLDSHPESRRLAAAGRWQSFELYRMGLRREGNCDVCPLTSKLVASIPGTTTAGLVYFSAMRPGTRVRPHCGPHNLRVRCHLGLYVRPGCGMRVGAEARTWQEGKCLLFDDSFVHAVWNRGTDARAVLLLDVWHPELSAIEIRAMRELSPQYASKGAAGVDD